jgi:hypothetical protein
MAFTKQEAIERARRDLARRAAISEGDVKEESVEEADFPDMALGAAEKGEMSGQMITPGWRIRLAANDERFEYRANGQQVRLYNFKGANYRI